MKKLCAALMSTLIAACLALSVVFVAAPKAHAAGSCNIVVTYDWSAVGSEYPSGNLRSQSAIQDTKSSDGSYCYSRAVTKYWVTSGTETINHRLSQLFNGGSFFGTGESLATVTVGTGALYYYGPWVDPCTNFLAVSNVYRNVPGNFVHSQTSTYEYRC